MVRTPGFHCRGMGSIPGLELRSCKPCIQIKKSDGHCHRSKLDFILKNTSEKKRKKMNIVFHTVTFVCIVCAQLCLTLCNPMDFSPPGSFVCGILQARILEWLAIFFYRGSSRSRDRIHISCISCIELSPALEKDLPFEPP